MRRNHLQIFLCEDLNYKSLLNIIFSIITLLGFLLLNSCKDRTWNNPFDEIPPENWAPANLQIASNSLTSVTLNWDDNSDGEEGFRIDRQVNDEAWQINCIYTPPDITSCNDDSVDLSLNKYAYRVYAYAGEAFSAYSQNIPVFICGAKWTITHHSGEVAPVAKTITYSTIETALSGNHKCWITQNLGAEDQALSSNETSEITAGWYWQFNKMQGYEIKGTNRTPDSDWLIEIGDGINWQAANDPCAVLLGTGWRLPTITEWENVAANGQWDNYNDAYESIFKLHAAGLLIYSNGSLKNKGSGGYFWSSSQNSNYTGWGLNISSNSCAITSNVKSYGRSIRCLKD